MEFFPDKPPIEGLLGRWLERSKPEMAYVADIVDRANGMLPDRHLHIGPSHFMTTRLNDEWFYKIWRRSVLPYIEEQFFDEPQQVERFELDRLVDQAAHAEAEELLTGEEGDGGQAATSSEGMAADPAEPE
jgi:5-methylcytosine-specific restriction enzyme B